MTAQTPGSLKAYRGSDLLCWVSPVLTIYVPEAPDRATALAALEVYRHFCPKERLALVAGTRSPGFARLAEPMGQKVLSEHLDLIARRRDVSLCVWDGEPSESWAFNIQGSGVPRDQPPEASFCQIIFPNDTSPDLIQRLAAAIAERLEFSSGHCGLSCLFDAGHKSAAFDQIYAWAKLYPGLDVEDLNVTLAHVLGAIKGASWLTLVGTSLWGVLLERSGEPKLSPDVTLSQLETGMLLRAGPTPVLGRRNALETPELYVEVERALAAIKLEEHREFAGRFGEEGATLAWLYRFLRPDEW
jgi:hypothetical protein